MRRSPLKKGWQLLHTSTRRTALVEPVVKVVPQEEQMTWASEWYSGWMPAFMVPRFLSGPRLPL